MAKYIVIDANVESYDSAEAALAALQSSDGRTVLYSQALLLKAEIVNTLNPSVTPVLSEGWPDMEAKRRDDEVRNYGGLQSANKVGAFSQIGRPISARN